MAKKHYGQCALCGRECELTYEHIPPKSAFNSKPAKMYTGDKLILDSDRLPWDVQGLTYLNRQQGAGRYSLCKDCNSKTGTWYGSAYREIAHIMAYALQAHENSTIQGIGIRDVYPQRFIKQVLSMFCSVNDHASLKAFANPVQVNRDKDLSPLFQTLFDAQQGLFEASKLMDELRAFVLQKDAVGLDKDKFRVCMYATRSPLLKLAGITSSIDIHEPSNIVLSEITAEPLGFLLYFNPPKGFEHKGCDITAMADLRYDDMTSIEMPLQIFEMNTYFPNDYRSKKEIESDVQKSKEVFP